MVAQVKSSQIGFNRKWCNSGEWKELTKPCKLRFPDGIRSCAKPRWVKDGDVSHCFHTSHDFQSTIRFLSVDQYRNENFFETRTFNWVPSFSFSFTSIRQKPDKSFTWYLAGVRLMSIEDRISSIRSDTSICQRTRSNWSTDNSDKSFRCCVIVRNLSLFNLFMFLKISICICVWLVFGVVSQLETGSLPTIIPHQHFTAAQQNLSGERPIIIYTCGQQIETIWNNQSWSQLNDFYKLF